jgi:hypothetical protein
MLLRKRLAGARLRSVTQPQLERLLMLEFEGKNELGDTVTLRLAVEIMAQYSNIIFIDENNFKEMIKNKFSSFVIEKSFQIIIGIDENYFKKNIKSNFIKELNNNFNSSDEDENEENNINNNNDNNENKIIEENENNNKNNDDKNNEIKNENDIVDYNNFILFKNKIFYIFENNASNKEKEKVINLLKQNFTFNNYVNNKATNGYKNHKNC